MMAGTLILEAIVVLLALPVVACRRWRTDAAQPAPPDRVGRRAGADGRDAGPTVGDLGEPRSSGWSLIAGFVRARGDRLHRRAVRRVWLLIAYLRAEVAAGRNAGCCPANSRHLPTIGCAP